MALFKIFKGAQDDLPQTKHEGYAYFTTDEGNLYIDATDTKRVQVNAKGATGLIVEGQYIEADQFLTNDDLIDVEHGGTGLADLTINAILVGNGTDTVKLVTIPSNSVVVSDEENGIKGLTSTADGALYKLASEAPTFGILPVTAGGTGANNAAAARNNLSVYGKDDMDTKIDEVTTKVYTTTLAVNSWVSAGTSYTYSYSNSSLRCGKNGNVPPIVTYASNLDEYSKIESAEATVGSGIVFTTNEKPENPIDIIIIDIG